MDIEIYCDESNQELLGASKPTNKRFFLIGGIWLPASKRKEYKEAINNIRQEEHCFGEAKWKAVSPSKLGFYLRLIEFFFQQEQDLRFRCIVIDTQRVDLHKYHEADKELGYYKFCYQLLKNWIEDFNSYRIFLDLKTNRIPRRLPVLHNFLSSSNILANVMSVQALPSRELILMQLADVLLGAVSSKFNQSAESTAKAEVMKRIEHHLSHPIGPTSKELKKFNVFKMALLDSSR
ncbi:MAG: DUF3800 domain-containing protein [Dehalococcoidia bacterium]